MRNKVSGIIGNLIGNYDSALFGLVAPFIASVFFNTGNQITDLILTYCILPLGLVAKPLGSLFFGWIGDRYGRTHALCFSLIGMGIATACMGFLPSYRDVGIYAPILLALLRLFLNFCKAGEGMGGAVFLLEHTESKKKHWMSALYGTSAIAGILIASGSVTLLAYCSNVEKNWRLLFWLGGATSVMGLFLRLKVEEGVEYLSSVRPYPREFWRALLTYKGPFLAILFASGFSYTTYALSFTFMNGYAPLVTDLQMSDVMGINTLLLLLDFLLLPLFGWLAMRSGAEKWMRLAALGSALVALPLFILLEGAGRGVFILVRVTIVCLGVAFAAPYYSWAHELVPPGVRYTILSLGSAIGSQLIGGPSPAICLWLYQKTGLAAAPGFYLMGAGLLAALAIGWAAREATVQKSSVPHREKW
ncbi:MAG: MFS transporter [Verrucomicrobia bacterium]|nr:MFS transporter [Verrucomicrobiota bacterium]